MTKRERACGGQLASLFRRARLPERLHDAAADKEAKMAQRKSNPQMQKENKAPTHGVFVVEGEGDTAFWTRIGAAWAHQDGQGFNLALAAVPLSGRLVVRASKGGGE